MAMIPVAKWAPVVVELAKKGRGAIPRPVGARGVNFVCGGVNWRFNTRETERPPRDRIDKRRREKVESRESREGRPSCC